MTSLIKGKYQIVREIARSNDIVYEALDVTLSRRIALKELNISPGLTGQARRERIERFSREARAAGRLSHPNIVSVFDFGEEDGRYFIAMEFLEGMTLRDIMQMRGAMPLKEAVEIACQILDALAFAHAHNVIHRDIKPDNIHVLPGGQVKLADFGIARLTEEVALTGDGQVFGTPSYMSPEQIIGKGIDYRSDLFSVAVLLYEMLAGRKPFGGDSVVSITYAIMNAAPAPLVGVPYAVEQVIARALVKDPGQRTPSAEQMKQDLRLAEQAPAVSYPPSGGLGAPPPGATGYGYPGVPAPPFAASYAPAPYGYAAPQASYGGPQAPGASGPVGPLPWAWNNGAPPTGGASGALVPSGAPSGAYPFGAPPFPRRRAPIKMSLPPWAKTLATSVGIAIVIGGGVGMGTIAFLRGYDRYRDNAEAQQVSTLMAQAVTAYNANDFAQSASLLEQAKKDRPTDRQSATIDFNLGATYIQLARKAESAGDWAGAQTNYEKALALNPDSKLAHDGLSATLLRLGQPARAREQHTAALNSADTTNVPASLAPSPQESAAPTTPQETATTPSSADAASAPAASPPASLPPASSQESAAQAERFSADRRQEARQLIEDGDSLSAQGDNEGARQKWEQAIEIAPGTPERDEAKARIDGARTSPRPGGA